MTQNDVQQVNLQVGRILISPGALRLISERELFEAFNRHIKGDWGQIDEEETHANDIACENDEPIVAAYADLKGNRFMILTEADRSTSYIMLPEEY